MNLLTFLSEHIFLVTIALVSGGMLAWPLLRGSGGSNAVSTLQATQMINRDDALMLDVRDTDAFAKAHILNARNIPMAQLQERVAELAKGKGKTRTIIVHCETGVRSSAAHALLAKEGFEKVFTLSGGIAAWKSAGLPVEGKA